MQLSWPGKTIVLQSTVAIGALIVMSLWPPETGKMLLVPVAGESIDDVAKIALAGGALLISAGPFPGSLVVFGNRSMVSGHNPYWSVIVLAAPPAGCGAPDLAGTPK